MINSEEFMTFTRPAAGVDVEKCMARLPKLQANTIIDRMHDMTNIKEKMYDMVQKERFNAAITEFMAFFKKV